MACCDVDQGWDALYDEVDGMHKYRGVISLPCMTTKLLDDLMENFTFREDDVLMVSYPQSNFFWVQEVLYHLYHQDTLDVPIKEKDALAMRVPFLEHEFRNVEPMALLENATGTRLMKSHFSFHLLEKQLGKNLDKTRVILWVQDPKDVVINYHDFWTEKGDYFDFPKVTWDKFFDLYKNNALFEGEWTQMNSSWLKAMDGKENFLKLHYEDAAKDLEGTVKKISKFLGVKANGFKVSRVAHMQPFDKTREWKGRWTEEEQKFAEDRYREGMKGTCLEGHYVK